MKSLTTSIFAILTAALLAMFLFGCDQPATNACDQPAYCEAEVQTVATTTTASITCYGETLQGCMAEGYCLIEVVATIDGREVSSVPLYLNSYGGWTYGATAGTYTYNNGVITGIGVLGSTMSVVVPVTAYACQQ